VQNTYLASLALLDTDESGAQITMSPPALDLDVTTYIFNITTDPNAELYNLYLTTSKHNAQAPWTIQQVMHST
jgi:hypothetical protein